MTRTAEEQEELEQRVIALWQEGRSQVDIGGILSVSRHVIAGAIHRLRRRGVMLEKRTTKGDNSVERKEKRSGDLALLMSLVSSAPSAETDAEELTPAEMDAEELIPAETDAEDGFFVFDLPRNGCKWPIGMRDGRHTFCGEEADATYCEPHARKAYTAAAHRRGTPSTRKGFS